VPLAEVAVRLHQADDVAIAKRPLAHGTLILVVVDPPNTLPVTEFKSRRVVDLRRVAAGSPVEDTVASGARRRR
jgi:hypothetical protein